MDLQLNGKVAIVTGGSRGIGLAIASELAREGCRVAIVGRGAAELASARDEIGGETITISKDLLADNAAEDIIERIESHWSRIDILVNNTGASLGGGLDTTKIEDLRTSFRINVEIPFLLSRLALVGMRERGFGRIVMMSSIYGREAGGKLPYNATKAAEISLTKALGREVAGSGITVNNVAPGSIRYEGGSWDRRIKDDPNGMEEFARRELPLGRFGTADEVAAVVAFLCSPRASLVNAASVVADGGQGRSNL